MARPPHVERLSSDSRAAFTVVAAASAFAIEKTPRSIMIVPAVK
jgi:hypothetical protein